MLIIIYIVTTGLILSDVHIFKIAGVLFGLCYLPGLTLISSIKNAKLEMHDLVLSFPSSIGISCILTFGLLYAGVHIKHIVHTVHGIFFFILILFILKNKKLPLLSINLSHYEIKFIIIALLAIIFFSIPVLSERIAISTHGFHHLSIVTGIFNGIFPPENPGLGGTSISYHWGFHSLVAAISYPTEFHPLRIFSAFNILSLFFTFCAVYCTAKLFQLTEIYCYIAPLALIGIMRADAGLVFIHKLFLGNLQLLQNSVDAPMQLLSNWVEGVPYLDRRLLFMNKYYNANNMPLGILLVLCFFMILQLLERKENIPFLKAYRTLLSISLMALAISYAFYLIIPLVFIPVWSVILGLTNKGNRRETAIEIANLGLPCLVAALISAPYLLLISSGPSVFTEGKSLSEINFIYYDVQIIRNLIGFVIPLPFIAAGFWLMLRQFSRSREMLILLSGTFICLMLSVLLRMQWYNEEKFSFILSFFFSFPFVYSLKQIVSLTSRQWLRNCIFVFAMFFLLLTPVMTEAGYLRSGWFSDRTYLFEGRHVLFSKDNKRNEAYTWIRNNTPPDSLLMLSYIETPYWDNTAHNVNYEPAALSERSLFVIRDVYAFISPEYEQRVTIRKKLIHNPLDTQVIEYISALHRPIYLLIEDKHHNPFLQDTVIDVTPEKLNEGFIPVFQNDRQSVYFLQVKK